MEAGGLKSEKDVITQAGVSMTCSEDQGKSHEPRNVGRKKRKDKEHNRADTLIFKSIRPIFQASDLQNYDKMSVCCFKLPSV